MNKATQTALLEELRQLQRQIQEQGEELTALRAAIQSAPRPTRTHARLGTLQRAPTTTNGHRRA